MLANPILVDKVQTLQNICIARATGGSDDPDYQQLRYELLDEPLVRAKLPQFVRTCRDSFQFWQFIKYKHDTYYERRKFIWDQFRPSLEHLESHQLSPADGAVSDILVNLEFESVHAIWQRALERRYADPQGAITLARTLLESVCKHILDDSGVAYSGTIDLPKLYKKTAEHLNLAPRQHSEQVFKQILGGCASVVEGLGALQSLGRCAWTGSSSHQTCCKTR